MQFQRNPQSERKLQKNLQPQTQLSLDKALTTQQKPQRINSQGIFKSIFRLADKNDFILMFIGAIASLATGAAIPVFAYYWGKMTDVYATNSPTMVQQARNTLFKIICLGVGSFIAGWIMLVCWMITGERQSIKCRKMYLTALISQQIGWYDMQNQAELATNFTQDCFAFKGAVGQKIGVLFLLVGMFTTSFVISFMTGWLMSLVILCSLPALGLGAVLFIYAITLKDQQQAKNYAQAGGKAQQAIAAIKTVKQLNGQVFQETSYSKCLEKTASRAFKYSLFIGVGFGGLFFAIIASYSLGFWYGSNCVQGNSSCPSSISKQTYSPGDVIIIFFSIFLSGFNLTLVSPALKKIVAGKAAAARIFQIINRVSLIQNRPNARKLEDFKGVIKFQNVTFAYPKNKQKKVLNKINLEFNSNWSALVGQSGCGKSTIFQMIMRFYDPDQGRITIDGVDIKDLDLKWLREKIGYVGQQPVLFATTIRQNLLFGKRDATDQQIIQALKKAQAYDFIESLQKKMQTYVGYGGSQISGGQKQRLAIARALLRNPKILLLDQATSALDRKNERLIQQTLDKITQDLTSITIAHRAKTIMKSDIIYVIKDGQVQQSGKFSNLQRFKDFSLNYEQTQIQKSQFQLKNKSNKKKYLSLVSNKNFDQQQQSEDKNIQNPQKQNRTIEASTTDTFKRIFTYTKGRRLMFALGAFLAIINGLIFPLLSILIARTLTSLAKFAYDPVQARNECNLYGLLYLLLAVLSLCVNVIQTIIFYPIGQNVTKQIRKETYAKILKMPISWFDLPKNNAGSLNARLSNGCYLVNGLTTNFITVLIQNASSLISGMAIAYIFEWRTALIATGMIPLILIAGIIQMNFIAGFSGKDDSAYKESAGIVMESMINIRTVSSLGHQNIIFDKYQQKIQESFKTEIKRTVIAGALWGFSHFILFIIFGVTFYVGTLIIKYDGASVQEVFTAIYAIIFSSLISGVTSFFLPDVKQAIISAMELFSILDSKDEDQLQIQQNSKLLKNGIQGNLQFKNVQFKYDSRTDYVFQDLNLKINKSQKVAFVGHSGCGKSTIFQLLLRFYQPSKGQILIDGVNIKDYDIHYLRSCFGVVSQEPVLFNQSFRYNITYNLQNCTEEQMLRVAKLVGASSFIQEDSNFQTQNREAGKGYDREVGIKGTHISGGQKQRVAIARAMIRNPCILLLDQATSALDSQNQAKIQQTLDKLMKDKTTIEIAHRINTIVNSDLINVFYKGNIVQKGKYIDLVSKKGYFYNLQRGTNFM